MEIDKIWYKAKDGRIFTDPLQCEEYEKTIGILPGSVGSLVKGLESHNKNEYIHGVVLVNEGESCRIFTYSTVCADEKLEDYVLVSNLSEEQRYITATVEMLLRTLKAMDKDLSCQYFIVFGDNVEFRPCGCMANYNKAAWKNEPEND